MKNNILFIAVLLAMSYASFAQTIVANPQNSDLEGGELKLMNSNASYNPWHIDNYAGNLRFFQSGAVYFNLNSNGNLGIGTASPQTKLHVSTGTSGDAILRLEADTDNNNEADNPLIQLRQDGGQLGVNIGYSEENFGGNIFGIGTRYSNVENWDVFSINTQNGNVGIGTNNPIAKLDVRGDFKIAGSITGKKLLLNDPNEVTDWNNIWQSGFYDGFNTTNAPEANQWFWGLNMNHRSNNSDYRYNGQLAIKNSSSTPTMYFRSTNSLGEGTWSKVLNDSGSQKITSSNTGLTIEGTGIGNYNGGYLVLSALGVNSGNEHASTWFLTHRSTDGTATIEFQRRNASNAYRGSPLLYKDGYGWRFDVANSKTSIGVNTALRINKEGNVGIGTTDPDAKLAVKGNIHAEEVKVDLSVPGPDYVFKEEYDLKTLEEVQEYIEENGHLPNIPSAKEMETNGIQLGEMNMKLLEKIEELTLYTLEQEKKLKRMDKLESLLKIQGERLKKLELKLNNK